MQKRTKYASHHAYTEHEQESIVHDVANEEIRSTTKLWVHDLRVSFSWCLCESERERDRTIKWNQLFAGYTNK